MTEFDAFLELLHVSALYFLFLLHNPSRQLSKLL